MKAETTFLGTVPAQQAGVTTKQGQHQSGPTQQGDDGKRTPNDSFLRQVVASQWLRRPVVRIGVGTPRTACGCGPGRPSDEGRDLPRLIGTCDRVRADAAAALCSIEDFRFVVLPEKLESANLSVAPGQRSGRRIVAIGLQLLATALIGVGTTAVLFTHGKRLAMEVVRGKVGAEVGAVAIDRTIFHQSIGQECHLSLENVLTGE